MLAMFSDAATTRPRRIRWAPVARIARIAAVLSLLLASVAPSPSPPDAPGTQVAAASEDRIDALIIDANVDDLVALEAAVRLRIGGCPVSRSDRARPA